MEASGAQTLQFIVLDLYLPWSSETFFQLLRVSRFHCLLFVRRGDLLLRVDRFEHSLLLQVFLCFVPCGRCTQLLLRVLTWICIHHRWKGKIVAHHILSLLDGYNVLLFDGNCKFVKGSVPCHSILIMFIMLFKLVELIILWACLTLQQLSLLHSIWNLHFRTVWDALLVCCGCLQHVVSTLGDWQHWEKIQH